MADIQKPINDLINNDYVFGRKLKISTKSSAGLSFSTEGTLGAKGTSGKLTLKGQSMLDNVKIDKACVDTKGRFTLESTLSNALKGCTFTVKASDGAGKAPAGELSMNYSTDRLNFQLAADVVEGPTLSSSATVGYEGFTLGGSVKYNTAFDNDSSGSLDDYNAALAYKMSDMTLSVTTKKKLSNFNLGVHQNTSSGLELGALVGFSTAGGSKNITLAAKKGNTTAKVDSSGVVSANYVIGLDAGVKLITSASVDATNLAGDSHKFGLTLNYTP